MANKLPSTDLEAVKKWLGSGSINIFGLPLSGKDTQCGRLAEALEGTVIAGGDILRSHPDSERIKALMASGKLFPTDFYLDVVTPHLSNPHLADTPLILSSLGRWHGEEEAVIKTAAESGHPIKAVVALEIDETEVWRRLESSRQIGDRGQRHDDDEKVLETRLEEFRNKTLPVIDFYRNNGLLIEVDSSAPTEEVTDSIIESLAHFAKSN